MIGNACYAGYTTAHATCYLVVGSKHFVSQGNSKYCSFIIDRFEGLIDREWLRGGHPFTERCIKVGVSPVRYKGQGAVFLLFLDCVWQVSVDNKNHETIPSRFFPEQETNRSFVFCHQSLVHEVLTLFLSRQSLFLKRAKSVYKNNL